MKFPRLNQAFAAKVFRIIALTEFPVYPCDFEYIFELWSLVLSMDCAFDNFFRDINSHTQKAFNIKALNKVCAQNYHLTLTK